MDLERITGAPAPVDEQEVGAALAEWMSPTDLAADSAPAWSITSLGAADWAMARVAELRRIEREYADQIALWEAARQRAANGVEFFEHHLEEWALGERTEKRKTFPLAHGTVATREVRPRVIVTDEEAAITWCAKHNPDALRSTTKVLISEVAVRVGHVVVGYTAQHKTTGEVETVRLPAPKPSTADDIAVIAARLGDDWTVEAITDLAAIDSDGLPVAGFGVQPGHVSASVTPLMP